MSKYTLETGLNNEGLPVIKCSPEYYEKLITECRQMMKLAELLYGLHDFLKEYPAVSLLSRNPLLSENKISRGNRSIVSQDIPTNNPPLSAVDRIRQQRGITALTNRSNNEKE